MTLKKDLIPTQEDAEDMKGGAFCGRMQLRMQNVEEPTAEQIGEFLKGSATIEFQGQNGAELYGWVQRVLVAQEYATQSKKQRGAVRAYIVKVTGLDHLVLEIGTGFRSILRLGSALPCD